MKKGQNKGITCETSKEIKHKPGLEFLDSSMHAHTKACMHILWPAQTCRMHACVSLLKNPSPEMQRAQKTEQQLK